MAILKEWRNKNSQAEWWYLKDIHILYEWNPTEQRDLYIQINKRFSKITPLFLAKTYNKFSIVAFTLKNRPTDSRLLY